MYKHLKKYYDAKQFKTIQKFLVVLLLLTISSVGFYACKKNEVGHKPLESLKDDIKFIGVINDNMRLVQNAKGNEEAITLITKKTPTSSDLEKFLIILGFKNFIEHADFVKKQEKVLLQLKEEYQLGPVDQNTIKNIAIEAMSSRQNPAKLSYIEKTSVANNNCESIRVNCLVNVAAVATGAHLTCIAADFTVILGAICRGAAIA